MNTVVEFHELVLETEKSAINTDQVFEDCLDEFLDDEMFPEETLCIMKNLEEPPPGVPLYETDCSLDSSLSSRSSVAFLETVEVREYSITLGDHPMCEGAYPISLDWSYDTKFHTMAERDGMRRFPRRLSTEERRAKLQYFGYGDNELEEISGDQSRDPPPPTSFLERMVRNISRTLDEWDVEEAIVDASSNKEVCNREDFYGTFCELEAPYARVDPLSLEEDY